MIRMSSLGFRQGQNASAQRLGSGLGERRGLDDIALNTGELCAIQLHQLGVTLLAVVSAKLTDKLAHLDLNIIAVDMRNDPLPQLSAARPTKFGGIDARADPLGIHPMTKFATRILVQTALGGVTEKIAELAVFLGQFKKCVTHKWRALFFAISQTSGMRGDLIDAVKRRVLLGFAAVAAGAQKAPQQKNPTHY